MLTTVRDLGAVVRDTRRSAGFSQAVVAARAGVSRQWLSRLETGSNPGAELRKVLDVLAVLELSLTLDHAPRHGLDVDPFADLFADRP